MNKIEGRKGLFGDFKLSRPIIQDDFNKINNINKSMKPKEIIQAINSLTRTLETYKKHNIPDNVIKEITDKISSLINLLP